MKKQREQHPELPTHFQRLTLARGEAGEGAAVVDVTEALTVLRKCLQVSPPPGLRARIILQIRREGGGCHGD